MSSCTIWAGNYVSVKKIPEYLQKSVSGSFFEKKIIQSKPF